MSDALADALLAARLFAAMPEQLGGLLLRGGGPARDLVLAELAALPQRRLPPSADDASLLGGVDIAASLVRGAPVRTSGLLADAAGRMLIAPLAERLPDDVAGKVAQAMERRPFGLVLLDDGASVEERAPAVLSERVAFHVDLAAVTSIAASKAGGLSRRDPVARGQAPPADDTTLMALAALAGALGVHSARASLFALHAARAHAALDGRERICEEDIAVAARLVLAPRATRLPQPQENAVETPPSAPEPGEGQAQDPAAQAMSDRLLEAAAAAIPADVLAQLAQGRVARGRGGGKGQRTTSLLRGSPLAARPGVPRGGARLALIDTLRAAIPWQPLRRAEADLSAPEGILIRKQDLRVRRFKERAASVTLFAVDASGSAALARLAEAKGAVELLLAQAYVARSEVALIAFRGTGAELLLPPTRSLTRARRELAQLPGGGGTPLASGIAAARALAEALAARGRTPFLVLLTDGSANIALDGSPGRRQASEDALAMARHIAVRGIATTLIDIGARPRPEANALARAMEARYLPLPMADARRLARAVAATTPPRAA